MTPTPRADPEWRNARYANGRDVAPTPEADDSRTPGQRDRDRILYTAEFRRLAGVTQVASPTEGLVLHNRLTHTLEVAQVARRLAERLLRSSPPDLLRLVGGIDADVVEAAAFAHDLGHPPFGHNTEAALCRRLDALSDGPRDGFEGNAQSFRIVTRLAQHQPFVDGLQLSRATLNAVLKYPWLRDVNRPKPKWGAYGTEADVFAWARADSGLGERRTVEAELMDWADDIAYAVHDVADFYRAGLIPLDRLLRDREERGAFIDALRKRHGAGAMGAYSVHEVAAFVEEFAESLPIAGAFAGTRRDRATLRRATSSYINRYVTATTLSGDPASSTFLNIERQVQLEVAVLKELTRHYVFRSPALATQQLGQTRLIDELFNVFLSEATSGNRDPFSVAYRELLEEADTTGQHRARIVADLIASMTEQQAIQLYHRVTAVSLGSVLDLMHH